jgi:hypothetical protein
VHIREPPREQQGGQHEQDAFHPVVLTVMNSGCEGRQPRTLRQEVAAQEEASDEWDAVRVEAEIGSEPRDGEEEQEHRHHSTYPVGSSPRPSRDAVPARDLERQQQSEQSSESRNCIDRPGVEVRLSDDAWPDDHRAEQRGEHDEDSVGDSLVKHR